MQLVPVSGGSQGVDPVAQKVVRVVDGDTLDLRLDLGFGLSATFRFRLEGIDTPEIFGPGASAEGHQAAQFAIEWLAARSGELLVRSAKGHPSTVGIGTGAFGRWLASVYGPSDESLSDALVGAGHATRSEQGDR